jgi:hypothetical protein
VDGTRLLIVSSFSESKKRRFDGCRGAVGQEVPAIAYNYLACAREDWHISTTIAMPRTVHEIAARRTAISGLAEPIPSTSGRMRVVAHSTWHTAHKKFKPSGRHDRSFGFSANFIRVIGDDAPYRARLARPHPRYGYSHRRCMFDALLISIAVPTAPEDDRSFGLPLPIEKNLDNGCSHL